MNRQIDFNKHNLPKILTRDPNSHVRSSKRSLTEEDKYSYIKSPSPALCDPFSKIKKASPKDKLQPIAIKSRISKYHKGPENISIRLPEITKDGKLRSNKHFLPALGCAKPYYSRSPELHFSEYFRINSEKDLITQTYRFDSIRLENEEGDTLDISFGKNGQSPELGTTNPFTDLD